ncbi:MAG: HepT-like ribonuclease domain-containing protein [Candidatus Natronoplasma sp.]
MIAMKVKHMDLVVEDDYSNIEKLVDEGIIDEEEANLSRRFNGVRNAVVHEYDKSDIEIRKSNREYRWTIRYGFQDI